MGSNTFSIKDSGLLIQIGHKKNKVKRHKHIDYRQAIEFKKRFSTPSFVSVFYSTSSGASTIQYKNRKTDPNVLISGADENYLLTSGLELEAGRNFTADEVQSGKYVIIIGSEIHKVLFPFIPDPIGKIVSIASRKYRIVGVLEEKGSALGSSLDRSCIIPLTNMRQNFSNSGMRSYQIKVTPKDEKKMDEAISEAEGIFRVIRRIPPGKDNNFEIEKSDKLANLLIDNINSIQIAANFIGLITLLGAAIGLMNIMLVSVTERTKEIGIRKALGASAKLIRQQFLIEAIVIAQMGGLIGVIFGNIIAYFIANKMGILYTIPWAWIVFSLIISFLVAIFSAYYPAKNASKLNPIESLRYE
jgi:putative ABC transport system permease protein